MAIGGVEIALGLLGLVRPASRWTAVALAGFLVVVTLYLLTVPPGQLERLGCQCFGERFRFQDIRSHLQFNGGLLAATALGAVLARSHSPGRELRSTAT